jgi:uncharacterized membrane protein YhiD involved in acid resistance
LLGGALGWERERAGKAAGMRTHMLVAMGAAFFVFVPQQSGMSAEGLGRVIQGLVAGIGFLGAGAILKPSEGDDSQVRGLTTAAGIWFTAAVGVAVGLGREATAVLGTLLALAVLLLSAWEPGGGGAPPADPKSPQTGHQGAGTTEPAPAAVQAAKPPDSPKQRRRRRS